MVKGLFVAHVPAATNHRHRSHSGRDHHRGRRRTSLKHHGRTDFFPMGR
ncbi:hypothetical protein [Saccharopolyspora oryzae]|uniref:Uncharacterized protein n=1 Tax=Saccharopolyspora oryzae TaxID=2997343 RepID=A0ABT4UUS4_9PSEU|nr:hypothetical protein [Saccharopolyspora oryzae]MDA3625308.1 hypothetical protein [Saccharopolyspora oryzae]